MIPILLQCATVRGFLPDALTCIVTEERNGIYELTMTYPVTAPMFAELSVDRFIKEQRFCNRHRCAGNKRRAVE